MTDSVEIGYLCGRGHFVFYDDPEYDASCGSKRMGSITVTREEEFDEVFTPEDYQDDIESSRTYLKERLNREEADA